MRHRLNRGGDRQLNRAMHTIAVTRMRCDPTTRAYTARRRAEGMTTREIIRCLKRYITRQLYRHLNRTIPKINTPTLTVVPMGNSVIAVANYLIAKTPRLGET